MDPRALSQDGYIIDQRYTKNLRFGHRPSSENGCGWIALYNLLLALGRPEPVEGLLRELSPSLLGDGRLGLNYVVLRLALRRRGISPEIALTSFHAAALSERCRAGIVFYRARENNHYAAFLPRPQGKLRFLGAVAGLQRDERTMAAFYWDDVKFPAAVTLAVL